MNCKVITNGRVCCEGDLEVLLSNTTNLQNAGRWSIVFFTGGLTCSIPEKYVIASYDGTTYSNCRRVDNGNILCYFRDPKLGSGQLCYKLYLGIADSDFSPNFRDDVYPVATNYELGPWPTDSVRAELDLLVLSGIINAQIVGATAETLPAGSQATVTLGGTATERTFAFGIPAGADGTDGEAAQITSATASVDSTTGTPSVNIELGGTPEKRTFDFKFSGLKGEPGNPDDSYVRYDEAQDFSASEQEQVWSNLGLDLVVLKFPKGVTSITLTDEEDAKLQSGAAVLLTVDGTNTGVGIYNADNHIFTSSNFARVPEPIFYSLWSNTLALYCSYKKASKTFVFNGNLFLNDTGALRFDRLTSLTTSQQNTALSNIGLDFVHVNYSLLGTTLTDNQVESISNSRGIILTNISNYSGPTVFIKGNNSSAGALFFAQDVSSVVTQINLNYAQKKLFIENIELHFDAIRYGVSQNLTDAQKQQARKNIGAVSEAVIGDINSVLDTINGEVI